LSLFNLTRFRAGFAKGFNQSLNVNTFPKGLLTHCMLLSCDVRGTMGLLANHLAFAPSLHRYHCEHERIRLASPGNHLWRNGMTE
jgi:hypothetical protein